MIRKEWLIYNIEVTKNYESYEAGRKNSQICCRRLIRVKKFTVINLRKSETIAKKDMNDLIERLKGIKEVNSLQMEFKE